MVAPFMISGDEISFLLGGVAHLTIYIELVVNHKRALKNVAAWCAETMRRVRWDVRPYIGRSRRHSNCRQCNWYLGSHRVDDFKFSWTLGGRKADATNVMGTETTKAGTVYIFQRHSPTDALEVRLSARRSEDLCECGMNRWPCPYSQETRLTASDKRAGDPLNVSCTE